MSTTARIQLPAWGFHEAKLGNNIATGTHMHSIKTFVYLCQLILMRDILVDFHLPSQVICHRGRGVSDVFLT